MWVQICLLVFVHAPCGFNVLFFKYRAQSIALIVVDALEGIHSGLCIQSHAQYVWPAQSRPLKQALLMWRSQFWALKDLISLLDAEMPVLNYEHPAVRT
jgi:hypothetical protein